MRIGGLDQIFVVAGVGVGRLGPQRPHPVSDPMRAGVRGAKSHGRGH